MRKRRRRRRRSLPTASRARTGSGERKPPLVIEPGIERTSRATPNACLMHRPNAHDHPASSPEKSGCRYRYKSIPLSLYRLDTPPDTIPTPLAPTTPTIIRIAIPLRRTSLSLLFIARIPFPVAFHRIRSRKRNPPTHRFKAIFVFLPPPPLSRMLRRRLLAPCPLALSFLHRPWGRSRRRCLLEGKKRAPFRSGAFTNPLWSPLLWGLPPPHRRSPPLLPSCCTGPLPHTGRL